MCEEVERRELFDENLNSDLMIENKISSKKKIQVGYLIAILFVY